MQVIFRISDGILKDQLSQLLLQIPGITVPDRITHADYCLVDMDDEQNKDLSSCPADRLVGFTAHKDGTDESGRFEKVFYRPFSYDSFTEYMAAAKNAHKGDRTASSIPRVILLPDERSARIGQTVVRFSRSEYLIVAYLAGRAGTVCSKQELDVRLGSSGVGDASNVVPVLIARIRKKCLSASASPLIKTERGTGYSWIC